MRKWFDEIADPVAAGEVSRAKADERYQASRSVLKRFYAGNDSLSAQVDRRIDTSLEHADHRWGLGLSVLVATTILAGLGLAAAGLADRPPGGPLADPAAGRAQPARRRRPGGPGRGARAAGDAGRGQQHQQAGRAEPAAA